jgi:hypothetical protein
MTGSSPCRARRRPSVRRRAALLLALALSLLMPSKVEAAPHDGFLCTDAISTAERRHGLPEGLLLALALTETGRYVDRARTPWPWSVNAGGEGVWFADRNAALEHARRLQGHGVDSVDIGCMQVNLLWHRAAFDSLEAAFEPRANVDYAARHLASLRERSRDWLEAAGRYHSWDDARAKGYLERLRANWAAVLHDTGRRMALLPAAPGRMTLRFALPPASHGGPFAAFPGAWPSDWLARADGRPLVMPAPHRETPGSGP